MDHLRQHDCPHVAAVQPQISPMDDERSHGRRRPAGANPSGRVFGMAGSRGWPADGRPGHGCQERLLTAERESARGATRGRQASMAPGGPGPAATMQAPRAPPSPDTVERQSDLDLHRHVPTTWEAPWLSQSASVWSCAPDRATRCPIHLPSERAESGHARPQVRARMVSRVLSVVSSSEPATRPVCSLFRNNLSQSRARHALCQDHRPDDALLQFYRRRCRRLEATRGLRFRGSPSIGVRLHLADAWTVDPSGS
jgi:hypothetical protein